MYKLTQYSIESRDGVLLKGSGVLPFTKTFEQKYY